jgi:Uma2 family endonuclease
MTLMATDPSAGQGIVVPPGGFTVDDLDTWPESHVRYELTDGALTVSPSPNNLHQVLAAALCIHFDRTAPEPLVASQAVEIRFTRRTTRIPDVLVVESEEPGRHWFAPAEVVLAVEIESPGSITDDRVTKPAIYARHGIPHYWRIELDPVVVHVYHLEDDVYREIATLKADERIVLDEPLPIDIAVADLLPRWAR